MQVSKIIFQPTAHAQAELSRKFFSLTLLTNVSKYIKPLSLHALT